MYDYLNGIIAELTPTYAVVECGGVGYNVAISLQTYCRLEGVERAKVYVHHIVREDAQLLYGFADRTERELFRLLIGVSGVGGGTARVILSTYSPSELANIISSENAVLLKNVKGLGLKTAQKIIVDLRDKVAVAASSAPLGVPTAAAALNSEAYDEALQALGLLGFGKAASEKVLKRVLKDKPSAEVEELIRLALKQL
ncbi:MAG: Holliday junction branch migration protein RuvA [Tidjanibacter sp.]|jgi:Holliday junction DNA helicase RuvA|nr:Holliday junction branch migration protein RuvA [Tidjanibacter sp.]MBQ5807623.1 Holliday junction branch migration protein RuvA [Tidjanibacter sp.]MBQ5931278.1 Holliday junction branch migration protein RuvA [Tidjanibacter sp.]